MPPSAGGSRLRSGERAWIEWTTWNDKDKRRLSIGMGGDRPFKETAAESLIEQVWCTDENPIHAVQKTEENLKILFERGVKFESESSGMGFHLVQRVAELAGMEVRLTLWPPHRRNPWHPDEQEARAKLDGALWVFVEWDVKDEGGAG